MDNRSDESANITTAVSMFTPVTNPVHMSNDIVKVFIFLKEREQYELEVLQKEKELLTLTVSPYTGSIDRTIIGHMIMLREFNDFAPDKTAEELSSDEAKRSFQSLAQEYEEGYDSKWVENALPCLRMTMHIADPGVRVLHVASCFFERLQKLGYGKFCTGNLEKATKLICKHPLSRKLRDEMTGRIGLDNSSEKQPNDFVKIIRQEAHTCKVYTSEKKGRQQNTNIQEHLRSFWFW